MSIPYTIIEVANCHGGSIDYLLSLIDDFAEVEGRLGIKFQPFRYDEIATPDFSWYGVYKELYFDRDEWRKIISVAAETKDVWLDLFDAYSLTVLSDNLERTCGVKLQASVLENRRLLQDLARIDVSGKYLLVNISGFELKEIDRLLDRAATLFSGYKVVIQIGFQGYPCEYVDAGLVKIDALLARYPRYDICFADHVAGDTDEAIFLPVLAVSKGCVFIEKHVMLSDRETPYDHFSAVTKDRFQRMLRQLDLYTNSSQSPFIPGKERKYFEDSAQVPFAREDLSAGTIPSLEHDLVYKRTGHAGLKTGDLEALIENRSIISSRVRAGNVLRSQDFSKAIVGTVIACRMKSTRLPRKALKKIGDLPSVECCIKNALSFSDVNHTVLATSTLPEDEILRKHTWSDQVHFFRGHPEDVIERFLAVADSLNLDIIVRLTADCPYVSAEITKYLLEQHFRAGADFTRPSNESVGTSVEIINVAALRKITKLVASPELTEYMTYWFTNNRDYFRVQEVRLPADLTRSYRLTLDFEEDLMLFNKIQDHLNSHGLEPALKNIFEYLDEHPEVAAINEKRTLKFKTDEALMAALDEKTRLPAKAL